MTSVDGGGGTIDPTEPFQPTINDIPENAINGYIQESSGRVLVKCIEYPNTKLEYTWGSKTHAGYMSLANAQNGWDRGEVVENDDNEVSARFFLDGNTWYYEENDFSLTVWTTHGAPVVEETYTVIYEDGVDEEIDVPSDKNSGTRYPLNEYGVMLKKVV